MPIGEKLRAFKERNIERVSAGLFLYGLMVYFGSGFIINEPTRTIYGVVKTIANQPDLGIIGEVIQYTMFWWGFSHAAAVAAGAVGFAAGPKVVDLVRRPVRWAENQINERIKDTPVGRAVEKVNRTILRPVSNIRHKVTERVINTHWLD